MAGAPPGRGVRDAVPTALGVNAGDAYPTTLRTHEFNLGQLCCFSFIFTVYLF